MRANYDFGVLSKMTNEEIEEMFKDHPYIKSEEVLKKLKRSKPKKKKK